MQRALLFIIVVMIINKIIAHMITVNWHYLININFLFYNYNLTILLQSFKFSNDIWLSPVCLWQIVQLQKFDRGKNSILAGLFAGITGLQSEILKGIYIISANT